MSKKIYLKTEDEIELIRESCDLVSKTLGELAKHVQPGIRTIELDAIAETFIRDHGAVPAFKGYVKDGKAFPNSLCISVNEQVVHGVPGNYELKEGDIVSVDCGVLKNGFYGDSAYTFTAGEIKDDVKQLLQATMEALHKGIEQAVAGKRVGDISYAVEEYVRQFRYGIVRDLVGHGVGRNLHEEPDVPNFGKRGNGTLMREGLVLAIEPMITMGSKEVKVLNDGWTIFTADRKPAAHYEHTVVIRKHRAEILTTFAYIEEVTHAILVQ